MKVTEHLLTAQKPLISFEILPPTKGNGIEDVNKIMDALMEFKPPFIDVTYHREEFVYKKQPSGYFEKTAIRKRPGTVAICSAIKNNYKVDTVPHLICGGFSKEETENALIDLNFLGIQNILALRGDAAKHESRFVPHQYGHDYAVDLVKQIKNMNQGVFLHDSVEGSFSSDFCIGIAGYPEKHFEAPNYKSDLKYLKEKVDAGADYIVTQMFFDNAKYFSFVEDCKALNIAAPIIPGIKPITKRGQIKNIPSIFHIEFPEEFIEEADKCRTDAMLADFGKEWCIAQTKELISKGAKCVHFYTMGDIKIITDILNKVL